MNAQTESDTRLHGRWLFITRLAWVAIATLAILIYAAAAPVAFNLLRTPCYSEPCDTPFQTVAEAKVTPQEQASYTFGAWYHTILELVLRLLTLGVALLIFWRRSDDWMAHVASVMLVTVFAVFSPSPVMLANAQPLWHGPLALLRAIALASTVGLFYLFPDGRFVPRWTRWLAIALLMFIGGLAAADASFQVGLPVFIIALATGAGFQVYRYRRVSSPIQRQQTKWVVLGIAGMVLPMLVFFFFAALNPSLNPLQNNQPIFSREAAIFTLMVTFCLVIPLCFLPVTLAFSLLRYRLWDVDIVISRTLVYGVLTASVVGLYILIVGGLGAILQTQNNLPGIVIAILLIAFLFQSLRRRLQAIANRFVPVPQVFINQSIAAPTHQTQQEQEVVITDSPPSTILHGRWLVFARLVWVTIFIVLTVMYASGFLAVHDVLSTVCEEDPCTLRQQIRRTNAGEQIAQWPGPPVGFADPLRPDQVEALEMLGLTLNQYGWLGALQLGLPTLVLLLIAAGLFWRKSNHWMVLFASVMVATFPLHNTPLPFTLEVRHPVWEWVFHSVGMVALSCLLIFPLVFPTGRFVPRWTRWVALYVVAGAILATFLVDVILQVLGRAFIGFVFLLPSFVAGVYAQLYRYFRVARPAERQQFKWVVVGLVGFVVAQLAVLLPLNALLTSSAVSADPARALVLSAIPDTLWQLNNLFIAVTITISVLRYRLWDIDIFINRSLVYGALIVSVIGVYMIVVGVAGALFQSVGNTLIAILATGLIAVLFHPLRLRLQRSINQLMYGERDDPYSALSRLGRRLEASLAPEAVLPTVVTTVRDVLKIPYVAIYLKQEPDGHKIIAETASPFLRSENGRIVVPGMGRQGLCMPLIYQGETLGYIVLGPRAANEAFNVTDRRLLHDLAPQVGVAVHAMRLAADLQHSRERLVRAREEERRRLRRDLHDGLGPQLAGISLKLETARNRLKHDPVSDSLLADLAKRTQDATADIRRLVYELRPPTLDELGLVSALREGLSQYNQHGCDNLQIRIDAPDNLPPLPAAVEVAAYRITQEALTNVIRHANAHNCRVELGLDEQMDFLCLEIQDDGGGLSSTRRAGVGLRSMRERAEELGGTWMIESIPAGGTRILVQLPCCLPEEPSSPIPKEA